MAEAKKLILLRHGKTGFPGKYIGATDVGLSPEGRAQLAALARGFRDITVDLLVVSPMRRCFQSAELAFPGKDIRLDHDLREIDFGRWEGLSFAEIREKDADRVARWADWSPEFCFPEGEQIGHFLGRVAAAGKRIEEEKAGNIVIIAHGGVIRALICCFLRLAPENFLLFQVDKGKFVTIDLFSMGGVLTGLNLDCYTKR